MTRCIVLITSGAANGLIRLRELLLDAIVGAHSGRALNDHTFVQGQRHAADLGGELVGAMRTLTSSFVSRDGRQVDYPALRAGEAYRRYLSGPLGALHHFDPLDLATEAASRAFWLNLYNALVLHAVIAFGVQKSVTAGFLGGLAFFRRAAYRVGSQRVSLEDIEHGILRGNRGNPYVPGFQFASGDPRLAWSLPLDPRIHFALNCAARSCPPIRAYSGERLDEQLELAASSFIDATVSAVPDRRLVSLPVLFKWYAADFGGRQGVVRLLRDYLPDDDRRELLVDAKRSLRFAYTPYDWGLNLLQSTKG